MVINFSEFVDIPVIDCHQHFTNPRRIEDTLDVVRLADFHRSTVLSLIDRDGINYNPEVLLLKAQHPEIFYAFASLDYFNKLTGKPSLSLSKQVDTIEKIGFDGVKMVEGKPTERKYLGVRFDDDFYTEFFNRLEERHLPLLFHVADPEEFWDPQSVPSWAKEQGWFYDSTYPSKQQLYEEVDNVLDKHPQLKVIFAHFYFLSADLHAASKFLDSHNNVHLDLTPGIEMYYNFSSKHEEWREFFIGNQDRILFGTDISNEQSVESAIARAWLVRKFLETDSRFNLPEESDDLLGETKTLFHGLNLPRSALEKIYCDNFRRITGFAPKKLDLPSAVAECERISEEEAALRGKPISETKAAAVASLIKTKIV